MIEIVSARRCIECDICIRVCPANVLDARPEAAPMIARQNDCQTCFLCEIYCPTDALYVAPDAEGRSEEHTSELQSLRHLVCRLLLEKKKKKKNKKQTKIINTQNI